MSSDYKYDFNKDVICPYCDHEQRDSWEINFGESIDGDAIVMCQNCEKDFKCYRNTEVTYSTRSLPCLDGTSDHNWFKIYNDRELYVCRVCDKKENRKV